MSARAWRALRAAAALTWLVGAIEPIGAQRDEREKSVAPAPLRPRWLLSVEGASAYESNVLFGATEQPVGDAYHRASAALVGGVANGTTRLSLDVRGDVVRFGRYGALDRETYDVGATVFRRWSGRVATQFAGRAVTTAAPLGLPQLSTTALLPLTISRTQAVVGSLTARLAPRLDLSTALDASRVRFDDSTFVGGQTIGTVFALTGRPSVRTTVGLVVEGRRAVFNQSDVTNQVLEADVGRDLGPVAIRVRVGGTAVQVLSGPGDALAAQTGSVELSRKRNSVALSLRASRAVTPAFGFGRALQFDQLAMSFVRGRPKGSTISLSGDVFQSTDPSDSALSFRFAALNAEWKRPIGGGLTLAIVGLARRRMDGVRITNTGGSLQISYGGGR